MNLSFFINNAFITAIVAGLLSIGYSIYLILNVLSKPRGDKKMNDIADAIQEGAVAYMKRQYKVVGIIGLVIFVLLFVSFNSITCLLYTSPSPRD